MNRTRQRDLGTPASPLQETVEVEIDGQPAEVPAGTSILRAARESGVDIPKLMLEVKAQYVATNGLKPSDWFLSRMDFFSGFGSLISPVISSWNRRTSMASPVSRKKPL